MRTIINPVKWMRRRGELVAMRAEAIRRHKARKDIDAELQEVTAALIAWSNRQDRNYAPGVFGRAAHGSAFRKMACGPAGVEIPYSSVQGHQREH